MYLPDPDTRTTIRFWMGVVAYGLSLVLITTVVIWGMILLTGYMGDLRRQMREESRSHARMLDDHGRSMTATYAAFQQMLTDHRAAMPTTPDGR
jgi:hypothetical protein